MSYPASFTALSKPSSTTIRSSTGGISLAATVSTIIQSISDIETRLGLAPAIVAFTADAGTDVLTSTAHGLENNDVIRVESTGVLPGGLAINTRYYVITSTTNTFQLATTRGGSAIDITSVGSGTHSFQRLFSEGKLLVSGSAQTDWLDQITLEDLTITDDLTVQDDANITGILTVTEAIILPQGASAAPTVEGSIAWDTDDDLLKVGTGAATKIMVDTNSTQTLTNKTLTTPTIGDFTNATHDHADTEGGGSLGANTVGTTQLADGSVTPAKLSFSGCSASKITSSQTMTNGNFIAVTFNDEFFDTDNYHDNSTNPSRMTVSATGKYRLTATLNWTANVTGSRIIVFRINGTSTDRLGYQLGSSSGTGATAMQLTTTTLVNMTAGDYAEVFAFQNSGTDLSMSQETSNNGVCRFIIERVA